MGTNNGNGPTKIDWPEPEPFELVITSFAVPAWTPDMFPEALRSWLVDICTLSCVPLDYAGATMIMAAGFLLGGTVGVRPKAKDTNFFVVTNCYGFIVGPSGMLKTPTISAVLAPLHAIQRRLNENYKLTSSTQRDPKLLRAEQKKIGKQILALDADDPKTVELFKRYGELEPKPPIPRKRLFVNDVTIPVLQIIQAENPRGIFYFRDELIGMLAVMLQAGHEGDLVLRPTRNALFIAEDATSICGSETPMDTAAAAIGAGVPDASTAAQFGESGNPITT